MCGSFCGPISPTIASGISCTISEQDQDTPNMNETQLIESVLLIAHDQAPKISQPCEETLDGLLTNDKFCVLRTGCPWRYLPSSFPPWQTVFYHFRRFRLRGRWTVLFTV